MTDLDDVMLDLEQCTLPGILRIIQWVQLKKIRHQWSLVLFSTFGIESNNVVDILNNWKINITRGIHMSAQGTNFGCGKLLSIIPKMKLQPLK
jgi:hypothetical protein